VAFAQAVVGPSGSHLLRNPELLVFITSPDRLTPFHLDAVVDSLVQIAGSEDLRSE
jgi:hypothetical protein